MSQYNQLQENQSIQRIVSFINNPNVDDIQQIIQLIKQLSLQNIAPNIQYQPGQYCALSGISFNESNFNDIIQLDGYYFLASKVREYYKRGDYYDITIGDLEFQFHDKNESAFVQIELTSEFIEKVFQFQHKEILQKSAEFYRRQDFSIDFLCQKTHQRHYISDKIRFENEDVSVQWAIKNKNLLNENQQKYVQEHQRMLAEKGIIL